MQNTIDGLNFLATISAGYAAVLWLLDRNFYGVLVGILERQRVAKYRAEFGGKP